MASPFDVFRKNQKVLMALLVGFSMIAFIAADSIDATNFPIFLGALFGALGLWLLSGKGGGEGWAIAAVGAVLGAAVGWYGPNLLGDNTAVQTTEGNLSYRDIDRILQRQDQANQFLGMAFATVRDRLPESEQMQLREPPMFRFGDLTTAETRREAAVLTYLFQQEADDLGITITDDAVTQFLTDVFGGKLTPADLRQVRNDMRVGTGELVDILREQIRARDAFLLLAPRSGPTPQELWAEYKKLEAKAEVTAVAVPADAFVAEVPAPSDAELAAFFDRYKTVPAPAEGEPGFLVPRQFQVAYVEIDMADVRKTVTPPTDEDVLAYYNANRSQFESDQPPAEDRKPVEAPRPAAAGNAAAEPQNSNPAPPAEESPSEQPAEAPTPKTPPGDSSSRVSVDGFEFVALQADQPAEGTADAAAPANEQPTDPAALTNDESDAGPTPPTFPPAPGDPKPAGPPSEKTIAAIREHLLTERANEAADERLQQVRRDIDDIVSQVTDAVLPPDDPQDEEAAKKYEQDRREATRTVVMRVKDYAKKNGLKFHTTPPELMSAQELFDSDDYAIGKAVLWEANRPFGQSNETSVAEHILSSSPDQPLATIPAQSPLDGSRFVALKIDDRKEHVPSLDEKGVKERVAKAWKLEQARELAKARADELAKADDAKKDLAEIVKGQTITGKADGQGLTSRQVGPFTWLRESTAPSTSFAPPDFVPTQLQELPGASEEFMKAVFQDAAIGQATVVPSVDKSAFYVLEVDSRDSEAALAEAREKFIKQDFFTSQLDRFFGMPMNPYRRRMAMENQQLAADWLRAFREEHGVTDLAAANEPAT
jgi:hypothetical protein